jgi:hypothetical protein
VTLQQDLVAFGKLAAGFVLFLAVAGVVVWVMESSALFRPRPAAPHPAGGTERPLPHEDWQREVAAECRRLGVPIRVSGAHKHVVWAATAGALLQRSSSVANLRAYRACLSLAMLRPSECITDEDGEPWESAPLGRAADWMDEARAEWERTGRG